MLPEIVREAARRFGDAAAMVSSDGWSLSYAELDLASDEVAAALAERGVGAGDLVALVLPSTPEYVVAYMAAAKLGAVTAGVNPRYTAAERAAVLGVARARLVVCTADLAEGVPDDVDRLVVERARGAGELFAGTRISGAAPPALPDDPDRLVVVVFTSGTTGTPRGAMFSNRQLEAIARIDVPTWDDPEAWGGGSPMVAATQFAHIGFMTKLAWYLRTGSRQHLIERWRAPDVLAIIAEQRMTAIGGIAPQLAILLRDPGFDDHDLSSVKALVMGGALSSPELVREARERIGAAYSIRYSSTESGGLGTATAFDADDEEALHTVGRPRPGIDVEIRDPEGRPLPDGEVGEVCLRSPCAMLGYWHDEEATAAVLRDGWLHTGDLGSFDERGLLRLAGRAKEMFVRGGYNVFPLEVESILRDHPALADVAIIPRPDPVMGEVGVAVIALKAGEAAPDVAELRRFGRERLAAYKLPEDVLVLDALPHTPMHKIDRKALRRLIDAARPTDLPGPA